MGCFNSKHPNHQRKPERCISPGVEAPALAQTNGAFQRSSYRLVHEQVMEEILNKSNFQGIVGLKNLGNTCFMNSALQCLANSVPLMDYFLGYNWRQEINVNNPIGTGGVVAEQFGVLVRAMWECEEYRVIAPKAFKRALGAFRAQFSGYDQQDSQEFLAFLLDGLHEDLNRVMQKPYVEEIDSDGREQEEVAVEAWKAYLLRNRSIIVDIFQGQLRNVLSCMSCRYTSFTFDPFMYMTVPVVRSGRVHICDCLAEFCRPEILSLDCQWKCPKCKVPRDAEKKMDIWIAPPIFIIHLKRFQENSFGRRSKLDTFVDFPTENLDLSEFMGSKQPGTHTYDLYGVSNHHGSLSGGHYTAFAKNRVNKKWYFYDDVRVKEVRAEDVCTKAAYVLFYHKVYIPEEIRMHSSDGEVVPMPLQYERNISGGLIKRQSITVPHYWPHVNDPSVSIRDSMVCFYIHSEIS